MGRITLFSEDHCEQSGIVKAHLNLHGTPFCEINLTEHPERRCHMIQLTNDVKTPHIFVNEKHVSVAQFEEQWSSSKNLERETSFRSQFSCEVKALPDPTDPRLAKPTKQATSKPTMARETTLMPIRLPDFSQWSASELTRQLLQVTKHPYIRKCTISNGMDKSRAKMYTTVPCFIGRDVLSDWKKLFGTTTDDQTVSFFHALEQYNIVHHVSGLGVEASYWTLHPYYRSHVNKYVVLNDLIDVKEKPIHEGAQQLVLNLWRQVDELWNNVPRESIREHKMFQDFEEAVCRLQAVSLRNDGILNDYRKCMAFGLNLFHIMLRHALLLNGSKVKKESADRRVPGLPVQPPTDFSFELPFFLQSIRYRVGQDTISLLGLSNWLLYGNYRATSGPRALIRPHWLRWLFDRPQHLAGVKTDVRLVLALSWETVSSPRIIPYHPEALDDELNWSARTFCNYFVRLDEERNTVLLPQHFAWYRRDFSGGIHFDSSAMMEHVVRYLNPLQIQTLERMHHTNKSKSYLVFPHQVELVFVGHNWTLRVAPDTLQPVVDGTTSVSSSSEESPRLIHPPDAEDISVLTWDVNSAYGYSLQSGFEDGTIVGNSSKYGYSVRSGFDVGYDGSLLGSSKRSVQSQESEFQEMMHVAGRQLLGEGDAWLDSSLLSRRGSRSS